jgi:hypothetical protein
MGVGFTRCLRILMVALAAAVQLQAAEPAIRNPTPADEEFAALARDLQRRGWNFDQIFAACCKRALTNAAVNPKTRIDDQVRAAFGGLWLWSRRGGMPALQGQVDKALHFLGGGAFEAYWDLGRRAAVTKERIDSRDVDNFFNLDDLAATIMGARWVDVALDGDASHTRAWLDLWATGKYTLSRSLPPMRFGHMHPGERATPDQIEAIDRAVSAAISFPATTH